MNEIWAYVKLFVVWPVGAAILFHIAVYAFTGKLPQPDMSDNQTCGSGRLKYDC